MAEKQQTEYINTKTMKSKFSEIFKLRQHTPLIHFQHDQDGATLRASELRPKIDAWIINKITGINPKESEKSAREALNAMTQKHPSWLVGGGVAQHLALDYKLHIQATKCKSYLIASGQKESSLPSNFLFLKGPYFADNKYLKDQKYHEAKRGIIFDDINVEVFCLIPELAQAIKIALPYIFTYNNFGTRQSKGFGCFTLDYQTAEEFEEILLKHKNYSESLVYRFKGEADLQKVFAKIDKEYKILKSGFADESSQIMEYFKAKSVEWEKPLIKRELVQNGGTPKKTDFSNDQSRQYIRALLGVAELYEFPRSGEKIKISCLEKDLNNRVPLVERFRSPITFKVFENNIYLLPEEIPDDIYGKHFTFTNSKDVSIILSTPPKGAFNLNDFLYNHYGKGWEYVSNE